MWQQNCDFLLPFSLNSGVPTSSRKRTGLKKKKIEEEEGGYDYDHNILYNLF